MHLKLCNVPLEIRLSRTFQFFYYINQYLTLFPADLINVFLCTVWCPVSLNSNNLSYYNLFHNMVDFCWLQSPGHFVNHSCLQLRALWLTTVATYQRKIWPKHLNPASTFQHGARILTSITTTQWVKKTSHYIFCYKSTISINIWSTFCTNGNPNGS